MTDRRGQNSADGLRAAIDREIADARTAIPATITAYDSATGLASVQPGIQRIVNQNGETTHADMPVVDRVPVVMPHAQIAGFSMTVPVRVGDSVLLIIADRSIDNWVAAGGIQPPVEPVQSRHHHVTDAIVIVGLTAESGAISTPNPDGVEIRNRDASTSVLVTDEEVIVRRGETRMRVDNTSAVITTPGTGGATRSLTVAENDVRLNWDGSRFIDMDFGTNDQIRIADGNTRIILTAAGNMTLFGTGMIRLDTPLVRIEGRLEVNGGISIFGDDGATIQGDIRQTRGDITTTGEVTAQNIDLTTHTHTGVDPGPGTSGGPTT